MAKNTIATILAALLFMPVVEGGTYKWVDSKGRVHFSDVQPLGQNFEVVPQSHFVPADREAQQRLQELMQSQEAAREARQLKKEERKQQAAEKKMQAEGCLRAQERRAQLASRPARRLFITSDEGERSRMTEKELKVRMRTLEKQIADLCGK